MNRERTAERLGRGTVALRSPRARTWVVRLKATGDEIARVRASSHEEALGRAIVELARLGRRAESLVVRSRGRRRVLH